MQTILARTDHETPQTAHKRGGNPFIEGLHEPMREELDLTELRVTGTIPEGLAGRYVRMGPNPAAPRAKDHWFAGDGMVHGLAIEGGKALWYRNRWIRSHRVAKALGVEAAPGPRHGEDTVNTNVVPMGGKIWALIEAGSYPVELSGDLQAQTYDNFGGTLEGAFSAHPHLDPLTGENHAIAYEARKPGKLAHVVIDREGRVIREEPIKLSHGPMIHDCAITERFVIILDLPVVFSLRAVLTGSTFPFRWKARQPARIGLMPRHGSQAEIIWCDVAPGFAFHVANAFDRPDGKVELDVCAYDTMFADSRHGPDARGRGLERWTIDPETRNTTIRTIDAAPQEFPRLDERCFGQPYRYAYTLALPDAGDDAFVGSSPLYRHDLETGTRQVHDFGPRQVPGEFVFVPRAEDSPEEEGWLIGFVIDAAREHTDLVILDAARFEDDPVARIHLPHRVPPGFHGNWIAAN